MTLAELCAGGACRSATTARATCCCRPSAGRRRSPHFARSIGDERTRLDRWETELNSAVPGDPRDTSTPRGARRRLSRPCSTGDVLAPPQRQQLEDWMRANETSSMRAGLAAGLDHAPTRPAAAITAAPTTSASPTGPTVSGVLLAIMTRSQADDPKAANMRPLIGEVASLLVPGLLGN